MKQASVQQIANGYTVTTFPNGNPAPGISTITYCADLTAVSTLLTSYFAS